MKLGGNRPPGDNPLLFSTSGTGSFICPVGVHSPEALLNTIWYLNTKLLGFRVNDESRQLRWGNFKLESDEHSEYVMWNERSTKTRQGCMYSGVFRDVKMGQDIWFRCYAEVMEE